MQRFAGEQQPGVTGHLSDQIPRRVRLSGAGRPVEQQSALEVLTGGQQCLPVGGNPQRMAFHPGQHVVRQHDVTPTGGRHWCKGQHHAAHRRDGDVQHLPAVDVERRPQRVEFAVHRLRDFYGHAGDLDAKTLFVLRRAGDQQHVPTPVVGHQQHGQRQAGQGRVRTIRQIGQRRRGQPQRRQSVTGHQLLQVGGHVVRGHGEAVHRHLPAGGSRPGVDGRLQVDLLERRQRTTDHRGGGAVRAEEVGDEPHDLVGAVGRTAVHPLQKRPELRGEGLRLRLRCCHSAPPLHRPDRTTGQYRQFRPRLRAGLVAAHAGPPGRTG